MKTVSEILSRKSTHPVSVTPETTVFEAVKIMAEKNIGSVIVLEKGQYGGLVTERDYSRKVILKEKHSMNTKVVEIMTTDLPHISPSNTVDECMEMMSTKNIRYLPVFENDTLVGIISMSDIVKQIILVQQQTIDNLNSYIYSS